MSKATIFYGPFGLHFGFVAITVLCLLLGVLTAVLTLVASDNSIDCKRSGASDFSCRLDGGPWQSVDLTAARSSLLDASRSVFVVEFPVAGKPSHLRRYGRMSKADAASVATRLAAFARDPSSKQISLPLPYSSFEHGMFIVGSLLLWGVALGFGIKTLRSATRFAITFDEAARRLRIRRYGWWRLPRGSYEVSTQDIARLELEEVVDLRGKQEEPRFQILLRTATGEARTLTDRGYRKREVHERARQQLSQLLGLPA